MTPNKGTTRVRVVKCTVEKYLEEGKEITKEIKEIILDKVFRAEYIVERPLKHLVIIHIVDDIKISGLGTSTIYIESINCRNNGTVEMGPFIPDDPEEFKKYLESKDI